MKKELLATINLKFTGFGVTDAKNPAVFESGTKIIAMPEKVVTYARRGRKIIVTVESPSDGIKVKGVSSCHPEDIFNLQYGCMIAESRAMANFYKALENEVIEIITKPVNQLFDALNQVYGED